MYLLKKYKFFCNKVHANIENLQKLIIQTQINQILILTKENYKIKAVIEIKVNKIITIGFKNKFKIKFNKIKTETEIIVSKLIR